MTLFEKSSSSSLDCIFKDERRCRFVFLPFSRNFGLDVWMIRSGYHLHQQTHCLQFECATGRGFAKFNSVVFASVDSFPVI